MKYRKKPVIVEAYQSDKELVIHTLEGDMKANIGDYIITGVNGEQYPCKPDIFEKTYELVTNTNFDRIKTMNVKEMADFLDKVHAEGWNMGAIDDFSDGSYDEEWLKNEVQEDDK